MPLTLLLDLDDTLLQTNMQAFIPAYFEALSTALAEKVPPATMLPALTGGTRAMMQNLDPALTLRQVFDAHFFPLLGIERSLLQAEIDRFYNQVFPQLGSLTRPIPEAVRLVEWAFQQGYRVVIATNPFFPLTAVQHRLRWAGLPPEKYPFDLITSYENFHFTKEMVTYYPEVMAQLGWPDDPLIMVGDDMEREVKPCLAAGFPVFWVHEDDLQSEDLPAVPHGSLASFPQWLAGVDPEKLRVKSRSPGALLAILRSTPAALGSLVGAIEDGLWRQKPSASEWCLTEVACHLRDVEREVNLPRLGLILKQDNPFLPGIETDRWVSERNCASQDGRQAMQDFISARKETLLLLGELQAEWSRPARHAIFGPTHLLEMVDFISIHDRAHIQQVWKLIHHKGA